MQNRYAGDIGDYVKFALLRSLGAGRRLGVAWYLHPDEGHNADGKHVHYLQDAGHWRSLDPQLFDALKSVVETERSTRAIERSRILDAVWSSHPLISADLDRKQRSTWRHRWFAELCDDLSECDLVFADPDNGLTDDDPSRRSQKDFGKRIPLSEVRCLADGRPAVIYHHNSRFKGGHEAEIRHWQGEIGGVVMAVRSRAWNSRTFFIVNPDRETTDRAQTFCARWAAHKVSLHVGG